MPTPPSAAKATRRTDALTKNGQLNIGKQTGLYDTDNVRRRVRNWQADGAAVVDPNAGDNVVVVEYDDESDNAEAHKHKAAPNKSRTRPESHKRPRQTSPTKSSPTKTSPTKSPKSPRNIDPELQAWVRRKSTPRNELDPEVKHAAAPLKRVVSDAHWRKDRSSPKHENASATEGPKPYTIKKTTAYSRNDPTPKNDDGIRVTPIETTAYDDGIRVTPMEEPVDEKPKQPTSKSDDDHRPRSGDSRRRRPASDGAAEDEPKRERRRRGEREVSRNDSDRRRRLRRGYASPAASEAGTEVRSVAQTLNPDDSISTRNGHNRKLPDLVFADDRGTAKETTSRGSKTKQPDSSLPKSDTRGTTPVQPVYGNRIEAWLTSTPGTSVTDDTVSEVSQDNNSPPAQRRRERPRSVEDSSQRKERPKSARSSEEDVNGDTKAKGSENAKLASRLRGSRTTESISEPLPSLYEDEPSSCATSSVAPSDVEIPDIKFSKHTPGANLRRRFPTTGKRLSTIASADTLHEPATPSEISEQDTVVPERNGSSSGANGLKRRLTRHDDLISVLSLPRGDAKSIVSARSIRTNRTRLERATLRDLWDEFAADESKYQRELRTLVDGVIPVLLSCVLSKSDSAVAAGLFGRSAPGDSTITKPIVDMGVALERLKAHHRRAPASGEPALITWAQGAVRIYSDYLKAWRMGFQDVVVNLAPAEITPGKTPDWDDGLARNDDGDLVNGDGERVDVAFLLKRPLVRLKYLAKTFKGINFLAPSGPAGSVTEKYQDLVTEARRRSNEERARLEDEAAAGIDATRARDPQSLALLTGVSIDPNRCVRARDYFDMNMIHSSGQQLDCRIELLYRDDIPERGNSGDVLICEISDTGRWLLFPPIRKEYISSRLGQESGDLVVMIRGHGSGNKEWQELLALHANDEETSPEWVEMLGSDPVPPSLARQSSFLSQAHRPRSAHASEDMPLIGTIPVKRANEVDIPIGEGPVTMVVPLRSDRSSMEKLPSQVERERPTSSSSSSSRLQKKPVSAVSQDAQKVYSLPNSPLKQSTSAPWSEEPPSPGLKRSKATRHRSSHSVSTSPSLSSIHFPAEEQRSGQRDRPTHTFSRSETNNTLSSYSSHSTLSQSKSEYSVWMPSSVLTYEDDSEEDEVDDASNLDPSGPYGNKQQIPMPDRRHSSEPDLIQESSKQPGQYNQVRFEQYQEPQPAKLQKRRKSASHAEHEDGPPPSPKTVSPPSKPKRFSIPSFTPAFLKRHRRSSSPLKHEYEPSVTTESSTDSELSYSDEDDSVTSESSDEEVDIVQELKSPALDSATGFGKATPPGSLPSLPEATLSPSQSASQAPYRTVPQQAHNASKTIASIFSWSERGAWEILHPHECVIIVTPGLVEAFDMSDAIPTGTESSNITSPSARGVQPLVAFEVTPLVPLRRGTALDISIRSPPTTSSKMRASNNVMFRSRNAEECELLYSLINTARINNPTYIALQNARGPLNESTWAAAMDQQNEQRSSNGSWFHNPLRRSNTYRSKASRPTSQMTDSSVGTMNSAFSALRRFNGNSRIFNIAKSTITSRQGSRSGTSDSLSSGASTPIVYDPSQGTPLGITNAKIRLYIRESQNKWRDMGSARLSILLPPRPSPGTSVNPRTLGIEKRIVVAGKTRGETLLDVTLGESCFERVARTGIAVSVWEDRTGPTAIGGVLASKANTYMIQHKTERECAYTFGLVGKLRY